MNTQQMIDHIRATTPKSRRNYRRTDRFLKISAGVLAALSALALITALSN